MKKLILLIIPLIILKIGFTQTVTALWTPEKLAGNEATLRISPNGNHAYFYKVGQAARPDSLFLILFDSQEIHLAMLVTNDGYTGDTIDQITETGQWKGNNHIAFIQQTGTGNVVKTYHELDISSLIGVSDTKPLPKNSSTVSQIKVTPLAKTFRFTLPQSSKATLEITAGNGSVVNRVLTNNSKFTTWEGRDSFGNDSPSGNYQFQIKQDGNVYSGSIQVVR